MVRELALQISGGNMCQADGRANAKALTQECGWYFLGSIKDVSKAAADASRRITGDEIRKVMMGWGGGPDLIEPCRLL